MSAAIGQIFEPSPDTTSVHEWLRQLTGPAAVERSEHATPPAVAAVCSAAVDQLEIAAALEAAGMSHHVVSEEIGHPDVFALAAELWATVPFQEVKLSESSCWRRGNASDLGRGALYVAPALLIHAISRATHVHIAWWALPLAMTWGWAMGQLTAFGGYSMRARNDRRGEARALSMMLMVAVLTTAGLAAAAARYLGGGADSVIVATCITSYMVANAVLVLHEEEALAALLLVPGAGVGVAVLISGHGIPSWMAFGAVGASAGATFFASCRHLGRPWVDRSAVSGSELWKALEHCLHGVLCGLALCVIVLLGVEHFRLSARAALVAAPLLVTLGLMEWRLRTFRADVETLSRDLQSIDEFASGALTIFYRGLAMYVAAIVFTAGAVVAVLQAEGRHAPVGLLLGEVGLGALWYVDLTLTSMDRLDLVMRAWLHGVLSGAVGLMLLTVAQVPLMTAIWWSGQLAVWVALVALLFSAAPVVAAPCSH